MFPRLASFALLLALFSWHGEAQCPPAVADLQAASGMDATSGRMATVARANYSEGTFSTYISFFDDGHGDCAAPRAVGMELSWDALSSLPSVADAQVQPPASCNANPSGPECFAPYDSITLPFDSELGAFSPFGGAKLVWEPEGHPPEGVYTVPQLLWQFYLVPLDSTLNITAGPCFCIARCGGLSLEAFTAANRPIPQACFPRGRAFTNIASASPEMGTHLVDFEAPELAALLAGGDGAAAWNYSVQWGAFDGEITFVQFLTKLDFLEGQTSVCAAIPGVPQQFAIAGWRPHSFCILHTEDGVRVELQDFSWYPAGCAGDSDYAPASYAHIPPGGPQLPEECVLPEAGQE